MERTLIIFKPDCMHRQLVGAILSRFESKGLRIAALKLQQTPLAQVEKHYAVHRERPFYKALIEFMTASPVIAGVLEGPQAIAVVRKMLGATNGMEAEPGTIRGDYGLSKQLNLVHASDSAETAKAEIALFFKPEEVLSYTRAADRWISE
ncbi:MAG: Nucleoside diphosphate kinase [Phycisphaerae bacterium]|nr:Nucleoside diphosphate kinase [Phycisphaerae bacterium]